MSRNRINPKTTDAEIMERVVLARADLVKKATKALAANDRMDGDTLVAAAQRVRNMEQLAHAQMQYRNVMASTPGDNARREFLVSLLVYGANDTYSGRENDSLRAVHDVVRDWVANELRDIKHEG